MALIPKGAWENDGCTMWFNEWLGHNVRLCCDIHDQEYSVGTSVLEFLKANYDLLVCGIHQGTLSWSLITFIGVSTLGAIPFFFGNKKPKPGLTVVTVYDTTQRDHSVRDGEGPGKVSSPSKTDKV